MAALLANPIVGRLTDNFGIAYGVTIENAIGGSGNDTIIGNSVDNVLTGNAGNDELSGKEGNDTLDGGSGNDTMKGGTGDDLYIVGEAGDIVTELAGEGTDTVRSSISYALGANLENLVLTGSALTGTGNELDNIITGNALGNLLDGGLGNDTMKGGAGDDLYIVGEAGDIVVELAGEGSDTVSSSIDYVLGANLENLVLTGSARSGTGNELDNVITGNALANLLDGGAGNDTMRGAAGDDTYIVRGAGDIVVELAGEGTDTVSSLINYALGANLENLVLIGDAVSGTGNELDNLITGNALGNRLDGGAGDDTLVGGDGVDFLTGGAGDDIFVGEINTTGTASKLGLIGLDVITDFGAGDKIDLSALGVFNFKGSAATRRAGDFNFKVYDSVNGAEKALGFDIDGIDGLSTYLGKVTIIFGDFNGNGVDFAIALLDRDGVSASDFVGYPMPEAGVGGSSFPQGHLMSDLLF